MPVREGRWESWDTRLAREKAEATAAIEPVEPKVEEPKVRRTRRSRKAAEAAIREATGVEVSLEHIVDELPVIEDDGEQEGESA